MVGEGEHAAGMVGRSDAEIRCIDDGGVDWEVHLLGLAKVTPWNPAEFSRAERFRFRRNLTSLCTKLLSSQLADSASLTLRGLLGVKNRRARESS